MPQNNSNPPAAVPSQQTPTPAPQDDPQNQSHIDIIPIDPEGVQQPGKPTQYPQYQLPSERKEEPLQHASLDFSDVPGHIEHGIQEAEQAFKGWRQRQYDESQQATEAVEQQQKQNEAEAAARNALYQNDPQQYKEQHPIDYYHRKVYDAIENGLSDEALKGLDPRFRTMIAPHVHAIVQAGLQNAYLSDPSAPKPAIEEGVIAPEGGELDFSDIPGYEEVSGEPKIELMSTEGEPETPGGHGGGAISAEEIKRGKNYLVKPNGEITYHGSRYAPEEIREGQAYVTVRPDGSQNVIGELSPKMRQSLNEAVTPREKVQIPNYKGEGGKLGLEFRGIQESIPGKHPGLAIYQDPQSGTSIGVRLDEWSPEKLAAQTQAARERMATTTR